MKHDSCVGREPNLLTVLADGSSEVFMMINEGQKSSMHMMFCHKQNYFLGKHLQLVSIAGLVPFCKNKSVSLHRYTPHSYCIVMSSNF